MIDVDRVGSSAATPGSPISIARSSRISPSTKRLAPIARSASSSSERAPRVITSRRVTEAEGADLGPTASVAS
jgi:hypothetical protein